MLDLSKFRQTFIKDSEEDLAAIASMRQNKRIGQGSHEVIVTRIHEKDNQKLKMIDKLGGAIGFSIVAATAEGAEQILFISVPLAVTFKEASVDKESGFQFRNSAQNLMKMGVNPATLREAIVETNGEAIDFLIGAQFILINSWPDKKLHLEYDSVSKAYLFTNSMGERYQTGPLSVPVAIDPNTRIEERYNEAISIAHELGYQFTTQMNTTINSHSTANNDHINQKLENVANPAKKQGGFIPTIPKVLNKTAPVFANIVKKSALPVTE